MSEPAASVQNTDREIWRGPDEGRGDYYADSLSITSGDALAIDCGGHVIVMPIRDWHALGATSLPPQADEIKRLTRENWQLKQALGYPIPAEHDTPQNPFKCGACDARLKAQ